MFSVATTTRQDGFVAGMTKATEYSLSWLQSFFAVLTSHLLPSRPEFMILLNFIILFIAQWTIFTYVKNLRIGSKKAFLLSFLPLIPGIAFGWAGGYIDMRRDSTFFLLLLVVFFGFYDYLQKPSLKKGIVLGILFGLTHWSRGNSLPYILCVMIPILIIKGLRYFRKNEKIEFLQYTVLPFFISLLIALPYYLINWKAIYDKYVFGSWGIGQPRIPAVITFLRMTPIMILGPERSTLLINSIFFVFLGLLIYFLIRKRIILIDKNWYKRTIARDLFIGGMLVYILVFILNALILGVGGYIFPNFPALVEILAVLIYLIGGLSINKNVNKTLLSLSLISWVLAIILLSASRIYLGMPPAQSVLLQQTKKAASDLSPILSGKTVSYLWLEHINVHDLNFYITQNGAIPIDSTSHLSLYADTEMPPNPNQSIAQQQKEFKQAIRSRDFIVLSEDASAYSNPKGFFFIFIHGKPVIEDLLKDTNYERVYTFTDRSRKYQVLKKRYINSNR